MARKKTPTLTDAELRLMEVIWEKGSASAAEVLESLPDAELAYTTVLNTLRILETKGYLSHTKDGKAFVYHPLVGRDDARQSAIQYLVSRFFGNSPGLLVSNLIKREQLSKTELRRLKKLIEESE
jgi:predicted transcriptional regulator